jgi:hypothetical protein
MYTSYDDQEAASPLPPRFHILKGLPPNLTPQEQQLVMAALLHDLVDTSYHPSKLGSSVKIADPYVQWLCEHHHAVSKFPDNTDLHLLQSADSRTSQYARILQLPTSRRKLTPMNTHDLVRNLNDVQHSVYQLYSFIYQSEDLKKLIASKTHPTETLHQHLLNVANWVLFFLRIPSSFSRATSVALAGDPGGTPGPVAREDPRSKMSHSSVVRFE